MRVISGSAKGRKLKKVPGDSTRPIMDRVKENLFNILGSWVSGTRWLDLFAGTGQVGIEALSRGAVEVVFVDMVRAAIKTIDANLQHTKLTAGTEIVQTDAFTYLDRQGIRPCVVIYFSPPQYKGIWRDVMKVLDERPSTHLTPVGIVIVQIDPKEYEALDLKNLTLYQQRRYGSTQLCFYELSTSS